MDVAYGIKKLQVSCVVEDEKVSVDFLEESITGFEDHVSTLCAPDVFDLISSCRSKALISLLLTNCEMYVVGARVYMRMRVFDGRKLAKVEIMAAASSGGGMGEGRDQEERRDVVRSKISCVISDRLTLGSGETPQEGTKEHMNIVEVRGGLALAVFPNSCC